MKGINHTTIALVNSDTKKMFMTGIILFDIV